MVNGGQEVVPPVNFGHGKETPGKKDVLMYPPLHSSAILTSCLLLEGGAFGAPGQKKRVGAA